MNRAKRLWRSLLFFTVFTALCGSFALPVADMPAHAAPQLQATSCAGPTFAEWTFEDVTTPSTGTGTFNSGSGLPAPSFAGGNPGRAVSFDNWTASTSLDTNYYVEFAVSTVDQGNIRLEFDYRVSGTGPQNLQIQYSADGGTNFAALGSPISLNRDSNFHSLSFDFSSASLLNDNQNAIFRIYGYAATGTTGSGTLRLDNVVFCGMPVLTIDSVVPNPTNNGTTVTWHSLVNGNYDLRVGGSSCTDGTVVDSGTYTTSPNTFSFPTDGSKLVEGANMIFLCLADSLSHTHSASNSVTKDTVVPSVTVNRASSQAASTNSLPIIFAVVFSEPINTSSFTVADITQTGSATGITWTITDSGDHKNFTVQATVVTGAGTLIPTIAAGTVADLAGNSNTASTSTDNTVTYNNSVSTSSVVISEFRTRGPDGANDEFIELYNPTANTINIGGWKINASSSTGTSKTTKATIPLSTLLQSGQYYLIVNNNSSGGYSNASVAGNLTYSTGVADDGGIALLKSDDTVVDQVGMSSGSAYKEGTPLTKLTVDADQSYERKLGGASDSCQDTNNNANDFSYLTPSRPQNSSTPWRRCGTLLTLRSTTTSITADTPDPSLINKDVTVSVKVTGGTSTPTGKVSITVIGSTTNCTVTLNASGTGSCKIKFTTVGSKSIIATYLGDSTHAGSISGTTYHYVSTSITTFPTSTPVAPPPPPLLGINEFVPRPGHDWNHDGVVNVGDEFVELINFGVVNVNLSGWRLDDEVNIGSNPYPLPAKILKPGERIVFYGSDTGLLLDDGGDAVRLLKPNGQLADAYNYSVVRYPDESYCRLPDNGGLDDWNQNCYPTPGLPNSLNGNFVPPSTGSNEQPSCPIADTLPDDFVQAECDPSGNNIWRREFWDRTGWYDDKNLPSMDGKWPVFAE